MPTCPRGESEGGDAPTLGAAAAAFYADLRLTPVLRQVLERSDRLLGGAAGSVSLVEPSQDRYVKAAERGASCQLGRRFPLDEGVTGQVVARRGPVLLGRYADLRTPHLPPGRPEREGAVAAVPIWWRGEVIGANVLFAGRGETFSVAEVDELELLTQVAAAAIVKAGTGDPSLAHLLRRGADGRPAGVTTTVTEVGPVRPVAPAVAAVAAELLGLAERVAAWRTPDARLHVAVVHGPTGLRLLLQDEHGRAAHRADERGPAGAGDALGARAGLWQDLVARAGGGVTVERVPGWGTLVRAELPYEPAPGPAPASASAAAPAAGSDSAAPSRPATATGARPAGLAPGARAREAGPPSPREAEVLGLLARGLSDREIAGTLVLSPKTVEKHVGALLRKTGARSRTGAVVTALQRGWLPAGEAARPDPDGESPP